MRWSLTSYLTVGSRKIPGQKQRELHLWLGMVETSCLPLSSCLPLPPFRHPPPSIPPSLLFPPSSSLHPSLSSSSSLHPSLSPSQMKSSLPSTRSSTSVTYMPSTRYSVYAANFLLLFYLFQSCFCSPFPAHYRASLRLILQLL